MFYVRFVCLDFSRIIGSRFVRSGLLFFRGVSKAVVVVKIWVYGRVVHLWLPE